MTCLCTDDARATCNGGGVTPSGEPCRCPLHCGACGGHHERGWLPETGYGCPATTQPVDTVAALRAELSRVTADRDAARAEVARLRAVADVARAVGL